MLSFAVIEKLRKELTFKAVRSSGAGGQHVNKVSSKIELSFDIQNSQVLKYDEKKLLYKNLHTKLTKEKVLILNCDTTRSQHKNKELAIKRFLELLELNLVIPKIRRATKPSKSSIINRLEKKKKLGEKKSLRQKPEP
jgi:ribosome-associated protein